MLVARSSDVFQVKLTGRLSSSSAQDLNRRIRDSRQGDDGVQYVILDATHLQHIPISTIEQLMGYERRWRELDVVTLWVGLTPYLANLLALAGWYGETLPAFVDLATALRVVSSAAQLPVGRARDQLMAWGDMRH